MNKKVGIWIVLILTSLALVIPSIAILYNLIFVDSTDNSVVINADDVKVSVQTIAPSVSPVVEESLETVVSTGESQR